MNESKSTVHFVGLDVKKHYVTFLTLSPEDHIISHRPATYLLISMP